ncbi:MAG: restriction endonuclease subunit S [candidate division WOR-3 bacterium]
MNGIRFYKELDFKDTEVGRIPKDWEVRRLGEVAEIKNGKSDVKDAVPGGLYPFFDRSTVVKKSNRYLFDTEAVIIPGEGYKFIPKYYNGKFDLHQRAYALFNFDISTYAPYVFYALQWDKIQNILIRRAVGFTALSLRKPIIQNFPIPLPPLPEQKAIAKVLSDFDKLIEVIDRKIKALERIKKGMMDIYFTRGVFEHKEFIYSKELGHEIPKDWEVKKLTDLADLERGKEVGSKNYNRKGEGIRFIRVVDLSGARDDVVYTTSKDVKICKKDDILITLDGSVGIVRMGFEGAYSSGIRKVVIKDKEKVLKDFLFFALQGDLVQYVIKSYSRGTTIQHAGESVKHIPIPLPPLPEQKAIADRLKSIDDLIENRKRMRESLERMKKWFMGKLLMGEIRVKEV